MLKYKLKLIAYEVTSNTIGSKYINIHVLKYTSIQKYKTHINVYIIIKSTISNKIINNNVKCKPFLIQFRVWEYFYLHHTNLKA